MERNARKVYRGTVVSDKMDKTITVMILAVLRKEVKQRKETLSEIESSGREDLVEQTKAEIDVLEKYLPAEMTPEAVEAAVKEIVDAMDPGQKNMGSVMKAVMAKLKGQADGKLINQIVRKLLA